MNSQADGIGEMPQRSFIDKRYSWFLRRSMALAIATCLAIAAVLALLLAWRPQPLEAAATVHYVAPNGDCGSASPCYESIQAAVDAATAGDSVKVAQGVYTGGSSAVVVLSKAITLTGGYTRTDWVTAIPTAHPTIIDAANQSGRRGLMVSAFATGTAHIEGFVIQNGRVNGDGGGIYITGGTVHVSRNTIRNNAAGSGFNQHGGGVGVSGGQVILDRNLIVDNTAWGGGGLAVTGGQVQAENDIIANNTAQFGGVYVWSGALIADHLTVVGNGAYGLSAPYVCFDGCFAANPGLLSPATSGVLTLTHGLVAQHSTAALRGLGAYATQTFVTNSGANCVETAVCVDIFGGSLTFVNPASRDYHLLASDAIDACVASASLLEDFDGEPRPMRNAPDCGADEAPPPPAANFSHSAQPYGWVGQSVSFTETAENPGLPSFVWDFGDGFTDTLPNTQHVYADPGTYTVTLQVQNPTGVQVATSTVTIYRVSFEMLSPLWLGQTAYYTSTSQVPADTTLEWDLGDGATAAGSVVAHDYPSAGVYSVTLTATTTATVAASTRLVTVYGAPAAGFVTAPGWIGMPLPLTNTTTTEPPGDLSVEYQWDFGDGTTSTQPSPLHSYLASGTYTVVLTATSAAGQSTYSDTVLVNPVPSPAFVSTEPDWLGQTTVFTNQSTGAGPLSYMWSFGDGMTSTLPNPAHAYAAPGVYTAVLTAANPSGSHVFSAEVEIRAPTVIFQHDYSQVSEAAGAIPITLTLDLASEYTATARLMTGNGTALPGQDYLPLDSSISFAPGQTELTVYVAPLDDGLHEVTETLPLSILPVQGLKDIPAAAVLELVDDDPPPSVSFSSAAPHVSEVHPTAVVTVELDAVSSLTVSVSYAASSGTAMAGLDFDAVSGSLVFTPGVTAQTFQVTILDDAFSEGQEAIALELASVVNGILEAGTGQLIIDDNDPYVCPGGQPLTVPLTTAAGRVQVELFGYKGCGTLSAIAETTPLPDLPPGFTGLTPAFRISADPDHFGMAMVRLPYSATQAAALELSEASLRILEEGTAGWRDVTVELDMEADTITGQVERLGRYVVGMFEVAPCSISINNGALFTGQLAVSLFSDTPGVTLMRVANDAGLSGAPWQAYRTRLDWLLSDPGDRIVSLVAYARFEDSLSSHPCGLTSLSDDIIYDPLDPRVEVLAVQPALAQGPAASLALVIYLSAADQPGGSGVAEVQVSNNPDFVDAAWQAYQPSLGLISFDGDIVYVRVRDGVGNISASASRPVASSGSVVFLPMLRR